MLRLRGQVLLGPDDVRAEAWVIGGRISFEPPSGFVAGGGVSAGSGASAVQTITGWVLPGLVDAHCHVGLDRDGEVPAATAAEQARTDRDAGTLLIRDAGQPGDTRWMDAAADLPVIIRAGRHIARPKRYLRNYGREIEPSELVQAVQEEAARGDGWVKLVGDWIDRERGDLAPCWPADALHAAIAAAHQAGARVTAHCFGRECLPDLIAAGIDCIEHATGLDDELIDQVAARGVAIVPTLINTAHFPDFAAAGRAKFPRYAEQMSALFDRREPVIRAAFDAGVPIFAGTDAGGHLPHGLIAAEVAALAAAGLPPPVALDAACWGAREWLGRPGLVEGTSADLVVYGADPRRDVRVLAEPQAIVLRGQPVAATRSAPPRHRP